ncbi:hypothetical protein K2X05_01700 [bacterium]|nr:hypothetical protein [bacterium]
MKTIRFLQEFFNFKHRDNQEPKVIVIEVPPLLRQGEYADVIAIRHPMNPFKRFTNVPWVMGDNIDEASGYEWGYSGCGPTDFALNILLHFTNNDETLARAYYLDFREEFIRHLPKDGGRISKEDIFAFLERMKLADSNALQAVNKCTDLKGVTVGE